MSITSDSPGAGWLTYRTTWSQPEIDTANVEKFRQFYDAYRDALWLYCLRRTKNRSKAEEVLGDTFTTAWEKIEQVPTGEEARLWLYGVARNYVRNDWRKTKRRCALDPYLFSDVPLGARQCTVPGPETLALDATENIVVAFKSLRISDQKILSLASWEKLTNRDIALTLGCSENTAKTRLHRARKRFLKALSTHNDRACNTSN